LGAAFVALLTWGLTCSTQNIHCKDKEKGRRRRIGKEKLRKKKIRKEKRKKKKRNEKIR